MSFAGRLFYIAVIPFVVLLAAVLVTAMCLTVAVTGRCDSNVWRVGL